MLRAFLWSLLAFLAGTIVVYLVLVVGIFTVWELTGYRDRDGGASMGVIFILGPLIAVPAGIVAAVVGWMRARRSRAPGPSSPIP